MKPLNIAGLSTGLTAVITAGILSASCSRNNAGSESENAPSIDVAYPVCDSVTLHKSYPGYLTASEEVPLVARVSGTLLSSDYEPGAHVNKGQILFRIEDTKYRDALQQAEAALTTAISTNDYAVKNYQALKKALESDAVSRIEVSEAESAMQESEAEIRKAEAAVETARTNLNYCIVRAPISGKVSKRNVDPGTFVDGSMNAVELARIYHDGIMTATFNIEDRQYINLITNQGELNSPRLSRIPIKFSESLPHDYYADLTYTSPNIDTGTGTLMMQAKIPNTYGELKSGMYITVDLPYATDLNAIMVKDASIGTDQRGKYLYTLNDSNRIIYTPVTTGELIQDSMRIITDG
ncbi:MAG: efflux RND transporter periplasmic adaptor subunit, partial [Muribaculaceae bacterium]|nr:efflux RND transporter periplasmic adaptor subunit [Muribaculaceae bacterium]